MGALPAVFLMVVLAFAGGRPAAAGAADLDGQALYVRDCQRCHGVTGRGDGADSEMLATPPRDLQSGFLQRYSVEELVRRIRNGVPLQLALDRSALEARAAEVEALAAHLERLPGVNWRLVEEGQAVYLDRCELCHGPTGRPELVLPSGARSARDLSDPAVNREITEARLTELVRHGWRGMPALDPNMNAREIPALLAFVRLLSPGYALYDRYCAGCHGDDGRGTGSFAEEAERPTVQFDRDYFRHRDPEQVRAAIWHMVATTRPAMPHFRHKLSADEARAVVLYLKRAGS